MLFGAISRYKLISQQHGDSIEAVAVSIKLAMKYYMSRRIRCMQLNNLKLSKEPDEFYRKVLSTVYPLWHQQHPYWYAKTKEDLSGIFRDVILSKGSKDYVKYCNDNTGEICLKGEGICQRPPTTYIRELPQLT